MDDITTALDALNDIRREHFDLEPLETMPQGIRTSCMFCPVAQGLPDGWEVSSTILFNETDWLQEDVWSEDAFDRAIMLPEPLVRFVQAFDDGLHPELELK